MRIPGRNKLLRQSGLAVLILLISLQACVHAPLVPPDPGPDPAPDPTPVDTTPVVSRECDPDSVYFMQEVMPVLNSNCAMSGCHDAATAEEGIILDSYGNILSSGVIKAGDPFDSDLYEAITETDPDKVMPPPPNEKLNADQIEIIRQWIAQGAQNLSCEEAVCDTSDVTYSGFVKPLLNTHGVGCHTGVDAGGGSLLTGYSTIKAIADNGKLLGSISHETGFKKMPQGEDKLPECDITKVRIWIEQGAQAN